MLCQVTQRPSQAAGLQSLCGLPRSLRQKWLLSVLLAPLGSQPDSHLCRQCRPLSLHTHRLGSQACFRQQPHPNGHDPGGHDHYGHNPYGHDPTCLCSFLRGSAGLRRWKIGSCCPSPRPNLYSGTASPGYHHTGHLGHTNQPQVSHRCPRCLWYSRSELWGKRVPDLREAHSPGHPGGDHSPQPSEQPCAWRHHAPSFTPVLVGAPSTLPTLLAEGWAPPATQHPVGCQSQPPPPATLPLLWAAPELGEPPAFP